MRLFILFLVIGTLTYSCRKKNASWDADYVIPLISDSLDLGNLVNDSTLSVNTNGFYDLNLKRELVKFNLRSEINIPDTTILSVFSTPVSVNIPPGFTIVNDVQEKNLSLNNLQLTNVFLEKGEIEIEVKNTYPTNVICAITLPKTKKNGLVVTDTLVIGPGSISNPTIGVKKMDVSYATMDLTGTNNNSFNKLPYQITITSDPNGPSVSSTPSNVTKVFTKIQKIELFYAKGYFGQRTISDTVETDVEALKKWISGDVDLQNVNLKLFLSNSIKALGRIKITELTTTKSDGSSISLNSPQINVAQNVNPATGVWETLTPSIVQFSFNSSNSNIESFLENAGSKVKIIYEFELNPLGNNTLFTNEIYPQSEVLLNLEMIMPLSIGLDNFTLLDTLAVDFSKNANRLDRAKQAKFTIETENAFPIQGEFNLSVLNSANQELFSVPNGTVISSGLSGMPNTNGVSTAKNKIIWELNTEQINAIKTGKSIVIKANLNTPDPNSTVSTPVLISEKSFIATKVVLSLIYQNEL